MKRNREALAERIAARIARYRRQLAVLDAERQALAERPQPPNTVKARAERLAKINAANQRQRELDRLRPYRVRGEA